MIVSPSELGNYKIADSPATAPGLDELQALLYASKRPAIEQRRLELVIRDDQHDGAPSRIEFATGRVVITGLARPPACGT